MLIGGCASTGKEPPGATAPAVQPPAPAPQQARGGPGGPPGTEAGFATFQTQCTSCHGNPAVERAPSPAAIREMPPEKIYNALVSGLMQSQGAALSDQQKRGVAEFMSGRPLGSAASGAAAQMPNRCASNPPLADPATSPIWNGWGARRVPTAASNPQASRNSRHVTCRG